MNKKIGYSILINAIIAIVFVFLNHLALQAGLEETFVFLAIIYGIATIITNAIYVIFVLRK